MNRKKRKTKPNPATIASPLSPRFKHHTWAIILLITLCLGASTHSPYNPQPKWLQSQLVLEDLISPFELLQKMSFQNSQILKSTQFKKKVIGMGYRNKFNARNQSIFSMVVIFEIQNPKDLFIPNLFLGVEYVPENDPVRVGRFGLKKFIVTNVLQSQNLPEVQHFFGFSDLHRFNFAPVTSSIKYTPRVYQKIQQRYLPPKNPYIEPVLRETSQVVAPVSVTTTAPVNANAPYLAPAPATVPAIATVPVTANAPYLAPVTATAPYLAPAITTVPFTATAPLLPPVTTQFPAPFPLASAAKRPTLQAAKLLPRYQTNTPQQTAIFGRKTIPEQKTGLYKINTPYKKPMSQKEQKLENNNQRPKKFPFFTGPDSSLQTYTQRQISNPKPILNRKSRQNIISSKQKQKNVITAQTEVPKLLPIVQSSKIKIRKYTPYKSLPKFQRSKLTKPEKPGKLKYKPFQKSKRRNQPKLNLQKQIKPLKIQPKRHSIHPSV